MFTGLVEGTGVLRRKEKIGGATRLWVAPEPFTASDCGLGDSVSVNGCCLTVAAFSDDAFAFDLLAQTLRVTSLGAVAEGGRVNLERAMRAGDRFGGHFVQGHVDGVARIVDWSQQGADWRLEISWKADLGGLVLPKGSITIDGISLTAAEAAKDSVVCWIIPHTRSVTALSERKIGDLVNLEFDLIGKYVRASVT